MKPAGAAQESPRNFLQCLVERRRGCTSSGLSDWTSTPGPHSRGTVAVLAPKTFDLLLLLVQHPGRALSKQELMSALWADTFVEEANFSFRFPSSQGPRRWGRWIETVPKHGYRFAADVQATCRRHGVRRAVQERGERIFLRDAEPQTRKFWLAGAAVSAGLLAVLGVLDGREPRRRGRPSPASPFRSPPIRDSSDSQPLGRRKPGRVFLERSDAGQLRHLRQASRAWKTPALTTNPERDDSPAWSPDGGRIAFFSYLTSPHPAADLFAIPALGGAERTISTIFPVFPAAQAVPYFVLDAGRKMACLRRGDFTRRRSGHLADLR